MGVIESFHAELRQLGEAVRVARKARGLSQEELAERAGFQRNYIGRIERGERNPTTTTLIILARALGVSPASLFQDLG